MKRISTWLALVGLFLVLKSSAVSLNDIQFWTGTGTNRAALVIEWSVPESTYGSTVPTPMMATCGWLMMGVPTRLP